MSTHNCTTWGTKQGSPRAMSPTGLSASGFPRGACQYLSQNTQMPDYPAPTEDGLDPVQNEMISADASSRGKSRKEDMCSLIR